jgi:hypothetical protein
MWSELPACARRMFQHPTGTGENEMPLDLNPNGDLLWDVRAYIYRHIVAAGLPPTVPETAIAFGLDETRAARSPRLKWTPEAPTLKAAE